MLNRSILTLVLILMIYQGKFKPVRSGNASTQRMGIFMKHFKLKVLESEEDISIQKNKVSNICDREQFTFLKNKCNQFKTKLYESLEKKNLHKLSPSLVELAKKQNQWISDLSLTNQDRFSMCNNEEIDDIVILQAINLLQ